ncbi:MAG: pantoate--beta-alanine ligase [Vicinamibacterales bacterium]
MTPVVIESAAAMRLYIDERRRAEPECQVGFVPTMGALHRGHARLIEQARKACRTVVVSIFVNPLQFDRPDDLDRYPRTLETDLDLCAGLGVDTVFAPSAAEMYPRPPACVVDVHRLADHLCGRFRPGHFGGMATVVLKLFQIVRPDQAYFGEKDAQQLAIIRRLVADLNVPVEIVPVPTVRDEDGLALSSRNRRLSPEEREQATSLYRALGEARRQILAGARDPGEVRRHATAVIPAHAGIKLEYLAIVDPEELQPVEQVAGPVLVAGALWVGSTRLIDNLLCSPPP